MMYFSVSSPIQKLRKLSCLKSQQTYSLQYPD